MLVIIQLILNDLVNFQRLRVTITLTSLNLYIYFHYVESWCNDIVQLRRENIVFHESQFAQNLNLPEDFPSGVLMVKTITDLFDRNFFIRCPMPSFDYSTETTFATDLNKLKIWLHHLPNYR